MKKLLISCLVFIFLTACTAGTYFVRPAPDELKLNKTTYNQVIEKMGEPESSGNLTKNGAIIKNIFYGYVEKYRDPFKAEVTSTRALRCYFNNNILVGYQFSSSFKSDNSDFDETKISQIKKKETRKSDILKLFGMPTGYFVFPMEDNGFGEKIIYDYMSYEGHGTSNKYKRTIKTLIIRFDLNDVVLDFNYSSSEKNI